MKWDEMLWKVWCPTCDTTLAMKLEHPITSTDQGARFIRKPAFVCEKCGNNCDVKLENKK